MKASHVTVSCVSSAAVPRPVCAEATVADPNGATETYSKEEILLRERLRMVNTGITSYIYDDPTNTLVFPAGIHLFYCHPDPSHPVQPTIVPTPGTTDGPSGPKMDLAFRPHDATTVSFVRDGDIWLLNILTGVELRVTHVRQHGLIKGATGIL